MDCHCFKGVNKGILYLTTVGPTHLARKVSHRPFLTTN